MEIETVEDAPNVVNYGLMACVLAVVGVIARP